MAVVSSFLASKREIWEYPHTGASAVSSGLPGVHSTLKWLLWGKGTPVTCPNLSVLTSTPVPCPPTWVSKSFAAIKTEASPSDLASQFYDIWYFLSFLDQWSPFFILNNVLSTCWPHRELKGTILKDLELHVTLNFFSQLNLSLIKSTLIKPKTA